MNLRHTCPDIPDDWMGNITDAARELGEPGKPISRLTVYRNAVRVLDDWPGHDRRLKLTGKQVKKLWVLM